MKTIATLGPSVRLVVFQFLMKSAQVPAVIPPKRVSETPPLPPVSGKEVLGSTPRLAVYPLTDGVAFRTNYQLVDAWHQPHSIKWNMSFVRFVFCHNNHLKQDELHPDFIAKEAVLYGSYLKLVYGNLWATQGHLNPYFEKNGSKTAHKVLMIGCAGRVPNDFVFSGGRDENRQGMGPKVLLSTLSPKLKLTGNKVALVMGHRQVPKMVPTPVS